MLRGFTDSIGVEWRVWEVFPSKGGERRSSAEALSLSSLKETPFANGWLCFESLHEKRRLAPIPTGWASHDPTLLEQLCAEARVVPERARRTSGGRAAQR